MNPSLPDHWQTLCPLSQWAIMILYKNMKVMVSYPDESTKIFNIVVGVLQGETLAAYIFIISQYCSFWTLINLIFNWNHFEMRLLNVRINFYLLRTFCPHLGSFFLFFFCFFLCCFFFHYVLTKFNFWPSSGDFTATVALRIEALSLYGSRWALSEDSGFKSYTSRPEVYLVKNVVR